MGNKARSSISVNSSSITNHSVSALNAATISTGMISGESVTITDNLTADSIISNSVGIILKSDSIINDTININLNELYSDESMANTSSFSRVGFICVSIVDNNNNTGSMALYTRGKIFETHIYTIIFEHNSDNNSTISLNTQDGMLTIETISDISLEIKALNLFER